jgi:hypothetical protein
MRRFTFVIVLVGGVCAPASAQWVVHDAATTARNSITAVVKEYLLDTQQRQHERIRQMAERLSAFTDLRKYMTPEPPDWRRLNPRTPIYAAAVDHALTAGDIIGAAYLDIVHPVSAVSPSWVPGRINAFTTRLATVDVADAINIAAADTIGTVRATGLDRESAAISTLEAYVVDPSSAQSATAVLDKVSGGVLIGARQRQARIRLLTGVVEQLLVENKRARETEATTINMQVGTWREAATANHAFRVGTGDALRTWRQP